MWATFWCRRWGRGFPAETLVTLPLRGLAVSKHATFAEQAGIHGVRLLFPAGTRELTILACWMSRHVSNRLFWVYFCYTLSIIFATVLSSIPLYVDLLAGAALAVTLILASTIFVTAFCAGKGVNVWEESRSR